MLGKKLKNKNKRCPARVCIAAAGATLGNRGAKIDGNRSDSLRCAHCEPVSHRTCRTYGGKLRGEGSNDLRKHKPPPSQQTLATSPTQDFVPSISFFFSSFFLSSFFFIFPQAQMENILILSVSLQMREQAKNIIKSSVSFGRGRRSGGGGGVGELPLAGNSGLQSIIQLLASYTVTLSELTNGKFLHTPLNRGALLHSLITARTLNATFVPLYSQRGFSFITSLRRPPPRYQGRSIKAQLMRI